MALVTVRLLAVGIYLRASGRIRPRAPLLFLLARALALPLLRRLGPRSAELRDVQHLRGSAYTGNVPAWFGARSDAEGRSSLTLLEGDRALGPAHAPESAVEQVGRGRYYHWYLRVVFSSSDNTDPRTNGRRYSVEILCT